MVCQNSGKFELSNFKKSYCAHIAKHDFFQGGTGSRGAQFELDSKESLTSLIAVIC